MSNAPYLSVVACSRNDNHGGQLLHRMQLFINGLLEQCRRHGLPAELILVEWNPPADRPRLIEALSWPANVGSCAVRIIEVSPQVHSRFKYSDRLPLFQMIAKNAGIRRARGEFILATNIDILFSGELIRFLSSRRLRTNRLYRIDRHDVRSNIPANAHIDEQLAFCSENVLRINERDGTRDFESGRYHEIYPKLNRSSGIRSLFSKSKQPEYPAYTRLHTNASGDFTLMSRQRWFALRSYPEFETYCIHLDSLLCHAAHHSGARERVLNDPMKIYHIEHGTGSGDGAGAPLANATLTSDGFHSQLRRPEQTAERSTDAIPHLDNSQFAALAIQMRKERRPIIFNNENWGLANDELPETVLDTKDA